MKVIVLGGGGRLGSRVLGECVRAGHEATAFVRSRDRLRQAIGEQLYSRVNVVEGDVMDRAALTAAMSGHEAAVQASGWRLQPETMALSSAHGGQQLQRAICRPALAVHVAVGWRRPDLFVLCAA